MQLKFDCKARGFSGGHSQAYKLCKEERLDVALQTVELMEQEGIPVSRDMIYHLLQGCTKKKDVIAGKRVHTLMVKHGLDSVSVLGDHLIRLFASGGSVLEANQVFRKVSKPTVFTWNAIISAHAKLGKGAKALHLYCKMQQEGVKSDSVTLLCILKACSSVGALQPGRLIHDQVIRNRLELDAMVSSSVVDMYAKCGNMEDARKVFDKLPNGDVVSWGAMIAGYASHGDGFLALELFSEMQNVGIKPNDVIFLCILKACGSLGAISQGRLIHYEIIQNGFESDIVVANTLLDMYTNCGNLQEAGRVFERLSNPDVVSWGTMIAGFARCGDCKLAGEYLQGMQCQGLNPDDMIYTSILTACSHTGVLDDGHKYFNSMVFDHGIVPSIEHYGCMVDLLGRTGCLTEAEDLLKTMPITPTTFLWLSLLTNCRAYHNVEIGRACFSKSVHLDPSDASGYMLMSNIYADVQLWKDVSNIQELRKHAGSQKKGGRAWIEVDSKVHEFIVGGESRKDIDILSHKLKKLGLHMKEEGYAPQVFLVLDVMSDEDKEDPMSVCCEKLLITSEFLNTPKGANIQTTKVSSLCSGCIDSNNTIYTMKRQDIILRDLYSIHQVKACL